MSAKSEPRSYTEQIKVWEERVQVALGGWLQKCCELSKLSRDDDDFSSFN